MRNFFKNKKAIVLSLVTLLLSPFFIIGASSLGVSVAYGQLPPGAVGLFGGRLLGYIQCTCNGGHVMYIGPPRANAVRLVPGFTRVYPYGQVKNIGQWQLGIIAPPTPCLFFNGWHCVPIPHNGNIMIIGTSGGSSSGGGGACAGIADCPGFVSDGGDDTCDAEGGCALPDDGDEGGDDTCDAEGGCAFPGDDDEGGGDGGGQ